MSRFQFICMERGCGPCGVKLIDAVTWESRDFEENLIASECEPRLVSTCCGADFEIWDALKEDDADYRAAVTKKQPANPIPSQGTERGA